LGVLFPFNFQILRFFYDFHAENFIFELENCMFVCIYTVQKSIYTNLLVFFFLSIFRINGFLEIHEYRFIDSFRTTCNLLFAFFGPMEIPAAVTQPSLLVVLIELRIESENERDNYNIIVFLPITSLLTTCYANSNELTRGFRLITSTCWNQFVFEPTKSNAKTG
jgi:hypothetical protein